MKIYAGEVYTIQNKSKSVMNFQEQEFFDFGIQC